MRMLLVLSVGWRVRWSLCPQHSTRQPIRRPARRRDDRIPDTAWIPPWEIPLNSKYIWPPLQAVAVTASQPRFRFEDLCGTAPLQQDPAHTRSPSGRPC